MLLSGDECRRTQHGNNNAYCQDNETSWLDWSGLQQHSGIYRFARGMIAFRRAHPVVAAEQFYTDATIQWFSPQGGSPDWSDPDGRQLACVIRENGNRSICLMFNAGTDAIDFRLPSPPSGAPWTISVDTSREAPLDLFAAGEEPVLADPSSFRMASRSSVILLAY